MDPSHVVEVTQDAKKHGVKKKKFKVRVEAVIDKPSTVQS